MNERLWVSAREEKEELIAYGDGAACAQPAAAEIRVRPTGSTTFQQSMDVYAQNLLDHLTPQARFQTNSLIGLQLHPVNLKTFLRVIIVSMKSNKMDTNVSIWKFDIAVLINFNSVTAKEKDTNGPIISTAMMLRKMATGSSSNRSHQVTYAKILLQFKAGFH